MWVRQFRQHSDSSRGHRLAGAGTARGYGAIGGQSDDRRTSGQLYDCVYRRDSYLNGMSESYIQQLFAERIGGRQYGKSHAIYKFEKIKRAKRAAMTLNPGAEIIDLGVGEPDEMAYPEVVEQLCLEARKPENRGYADNGDAVLKHAAARYLERLCGGSGINP